jgi:hypothetical protein
MLIQIVLTGCLVIWGYRIGKAVGKRQTKLKIHQVLLARDPFYSLGKLNQELWAYKTKHEPTKWYQKLPKF